MVKNQITNNIEDMAYLESQTKEEKVIECERCKRLYKWIDHVGCTPSKMQRYEKLLGYVKKLTEVQDQEYPLHIFYDNYDMPFPDELLKEIGE